MTFLKREEAGHKVSDGALMQNGRFEARPGGKEEKAAATCDDEDLEDWRSVQAEQEKGGVGEDRVTTLGCMGSRKYYVVVKGGLGYWGKCSQSLPSVGPWA